MRSLLSGRVCLAALIAVVVGLAAGGIAYASIPGPGGVINGCYAKNGGSLRVIDSSQSCETKKETALNWNQAGPTGARGPTGPSGSGPITVAVTVPVNNTAVPIAVLDNGLTITGSCIGGTPGTDIAPSQTGNLQASGTRTFGVDVFSGQIQPVAIDNPFDLQTSGFPYNDVNVMARDSTIGDFARIDLHAEWKAPNCAVWGMIIPPS